MIRMIPRLKDKTVEYVDLTMLVLGGINIIRTLASDDEQSYKPPTLGKVQTLNFLLLVESPCLNWYKARMDGPYSCHLNLSPIYYIHSLNE